MNVDNTSLPPEIWREIIKLANTFLTYFDLISNPTDWPDSAMSEPPAEYRDHLNTRMSLKLTSRSFSTIVDEFPIDVFWIYGTEHAYRVEKELRRWFSAGIGGSAAQNNVASSNQQPRRFRIRHLFLHHKITHKHDPHESPHWDLHNLYARIFQYCTDLSGFSYVNMTSESFNEVLANAIADKFPSRLRCIHWNAFFLASLTSRFFHRVAHSLRAFRADRAQTSGSLRDGVSLPVLTHLDMSSTDLKWIVKWKLPSVTHMTIRDISSAPVLSEFLASVNLTLISLRIIGMTVRLPIDQILAGAPNLQELYYYLGDPHYASADWISVPRHQCLKYVTIKIMYFTRHSLLKFVRHIIKEIFPVLYSVTLELPAANVERVSESTVTAFLSENLDLSNHPIIVRMS